ncbi:tetratricopeptide repeat protein, partial [Prosthecobacter sp.]|uniref:tetratricopeptide repeat protein n=1 Tax=Prosthecobacter sp. TaxID=1965333 RepID=UPI0037C522C2
MTTTDALRILDLTAPISRAQLTTAYQDALLVWCVGRFEGNPELIAKANTQSAGVKAAHALLQAVPDGAFPFIKAKASSRTSRHSPSSQPLPAPKRPFASQQQHQQPPSFSQPPPPPQQPWEATSAAQPRASRPRPVSQPAEPQPLVKKTASTLARIAIGLSVGAAVLGLAFFLQFPSQPPAASAATATTSESTPAPPTTAPPTTLADTTPLPELRTRAEQGEVQAQRLLGQRLLNGDGVPKDAAEAVKWLRLAADHGDGRAQYLLGGAYFQGSGVAKDEIAALTWVRKAAAQGDPNAQFDLGEFYLRGVGVVKDFAE